MFNKDKDTITYICTYNMSFICSVCAQLHVTGMECKNCVKMSVMITIFGRWELAVADNVYIKNGSRTNIGVQNYNNYQY